MSTNPHGNIYVFIQEEEKKDQARFWVISSTFLLLASLPLIALSH